MWLIFYDDCFSVSEYNETDAWVQAVGSYDDGGLYRRCIQDCPRACRTAEVGVIFTPFLFPLNPNNKKNK